MQRKLGARRAARVFLSLSVVVLSIGGCRPGPPLEPTQKPVIGFMDLVDEDLAKCRSNPNLAPVCPTRVPQANQEEGFHHRAAVDEFGRGHFLFDLEFGAPHAEDINEGDRPPRFLHITVHAGDLSEAFPFKWPGYPTPRGVTRGVKPEDFGTQEWGGRIGDLVQAPNYPAGGMVGGHLVFRWRERGTEYAISMHSWLPKSETFAALEAVVESIPGRSDP